MKIWEMVGLWHYTIPGFFLLAQFGLGMLVALGNLVNNSVFLYLSEESSRSSNDRSYAEGKSLTYASAKLSGVFQRCLSQSFFFLHHVT